MTAVNEADLLQKVAAAWDLDDFVASDRLLSEFSELTTVSAPLTARRIKSLLETGHRWDALDLLAKSKEVWQDSADILAIEAHYLSFQLVSEDAWRVVKRAVLADPENPEVKRVFIELEFDFGDRPRALPLAAQLAYSVNTPRSWGYYASIAREVEPTRSARLLEEFEERFPESYAFYNARSWGQLVAGEVDQAMEGWITASRISPNSKQPLHGLAIAHIHKRDWTEVERWSRLALALDSEDSFAMGLMGLVARNTNRVDEAREWNQRLMSATPYAVQLFQASELSRRTGGEKPQELLDLINPLLASPSHSIRILAMHRAITELLDLRQIARAHAILDGWERIAPNDVRVYEQRARTYFRAKSFHLAAKSCEEAMPRFPRSLSLRTCRAEALAEMGISDECSAAIQELLDWPRKSANDYVELIAPLLRSGRFDELVKVMEEAHARFPDSAYIESRMIRVYVAAGHLSGTWREAKAKGWSRETRKLFWRAVKRRFARMYG